jgi:hypothetical protein
MVNFYPAKNNGDEQQGLALQPAKDEHLGVPGVISGKFSVRKHARNPQTVVSENYIRKKQYVVLSMSSHVAVGFSPWIVQLRAFLQFLYTYNHLIKSQLQLTVNLPIVTPGTPYFNY